VEWRISPLKKVFGAVLRYLKQTDRTLLVFSVLAALYGLVLVYSATLYLSTGGGMTRTALTQIIAIVIGFASMIVLSKIDYHTIANWWKVLAAISVLLFIATLVMGKGRSGSLDKSWLYIGSFSIQPAEFIKVAFIVTFAKHFDMVKDDVSAPKNVLLLGFHAAVPIGLILLTKDMGMALVFVVIFICMLFASNVKMRYFAGGAIGLLILAPLIWNKLFGEGSTQQNRILALFDPTNPNYSKDMYQQNQGIAALSSGEIWGYGLFNGPKTQASYSNALPERQNDMIFAVAGEELGLIGCIAIILILTVILVRFLIVASHSKDSMGAMICIGAFSTFSVQMILNIGMCLRFLPVVGLTLPFFSSGGTSAVSSFFAIGIVLSVYMHRKDLMFAGQGSD
jgi:rod shape determining protein RodA